MYRRVSTVSLFLKSNINISLYENQSAQLYKHDKGRPCRPNIIFFHLLDLVAVRVRDFHVQFLSRFLGRACEIVLYILSFLALENGSISILCNSQIHLVMYTLL